MLGEPSSLLPIFWERSRRQNPPSQQELTEREQCHLLQQQHLARSEQAKIATSCFVVGNVKKRGEKKRGGGREQPKKRNLLNGVLCWRRVYK